MWCNVSQERPNTTLEVVVEFIALLLLKAVLVCEMAEGSVGMRDGWPHMGMMGRVAISA